MIRLGSSTFRICNSTQHRLGAAIDAEWVSVLLIVGAPLWPVRAGARIKCKRAQAHVATIYTRNIPALHARNSETTHAF